MPFPSTGKLSLSGYSEKPESALLRSEMESGPAKQALIKSRVMVERSITLHYSFAEYAAFKAWFKSTDCNRGASWFDWLDPIDGATKQARLKNGDYDALPRSGGEGAVLEWDVSMIIETWDS